MRKLAMPSIKSEHVETCRLTLQIVDMTKDNTSRFSRLNKKKTMYETPKVQWA